MIMTQWFRLCSQFPWGCCIAHVESNGYMNQRSGILILGIRARFSLRARTAELVVVARNSCNEEILRLGYVRVLYV